MTTAALPAPLWAFSPRRSTGKCKERPKAMTLILIIIILVLLFGGGGYYGYQGGYYDHRGHGLIWLVLIVIVLVLLFGHHGHRMI
jgi:hypothetical protein